MKKILISSLLFLLIASSANAVTLNLKNAPQERTLLLTHKLKDW